MDNDKVMTTEAYNFFLPGYVVGAGGCVEGATVAVILKEERTSGVKIAPS